MYTPPKDLIPGRLNLVGHDSNAMAIMASVRTALKEAGNSTETLNQVRDDMMSGDYDDLLYVAMSVTFDD